MNDPVFEPLEEELAARLAAYDEALERGESDSSAASIDTPLELQPRLQKNLAVLQLLRDAWTSRKPAGMRWGFGSMPNRLGRFEIRRELGRGGYGVVFLAHDPKLGRDVALKIPRTDVLTTQELRARFHHEARAAAGLDHSGIVAVYEAGEIGPICYIASAYCPGVTLAKWLKQQTTPVSFETCATLTAALADAVHHAHSRGVLHRDLKPANILLSDSLDDPKITDFGLAKLHEDAGSLHTRSGDIVGTPNYMAPEQASGRSKNITTAADVYALGAILYELLTNRPPFQGESVLETLRQVETEEPVRPGVRRSDVPRDLENICLKCLQKDARQRYASAAELAADLRRFLAHEPVAARPLSRLERLTQWCRRKPAWAAMIAALILVSLTGAAAVVQQWLRADANAVDAREQRELAEKRRLKAHQAVHDYFSLVSTNKLLGKPGMQELRKDLLQSALRYYEEFLKESADDPAVQAELAETFVRVAQIQDILGATAAADAAFKNALAIFTAMAAANPADVAVHAKLTRTIYRYAVHCTDCGQHKEAIRLLAQAQVGFRQLCEAEPHDPEHRFRLGQSYLQLGHVQSMSGQPTDVLPNFMQARGILEELCKDRPQVLTYQAALGIAYHNSGNELRKKGDLPEALKAFNLCRDIRLQLAEAQPEDPARQNDLVWILLKIGSFQDANGQTQDAFHSYEEAHRIGGILAKSNPHVPEYQRIWATALANLGGLHRTAGKPADAKQYLEEALEVRERIAQKFPDLADVDKEIGQSCRDLGALRRETGDFADALKLTRRALDSFEKALRLNPGDLRVQNGIAITWEYLGHIQVALKNPKEAIDAFRQAVRIQAAVLNKAPEQMDHREHLNHHYRYLAQTLQTHGEIAEAIAATTERRKLWPSDAPRLVEVAEDLASCLAAAPKDTQRIDQVMEILQAAVSSGYRDAGHLRAAPALLPLQDRSEFRKLLAQMETAAKQPPSK